MYLEKTDSPKDILNMFVIFFNTFFEEICNKNRLQHREKREKGR
jgi:hypothetical protein